MTTTDNVTADEIPYFPATAPPLFSDPDATLALTTPVLEALAGVVAVPDHQLSAPTPCPKYDVQQLRDHVLGWLQFFAAALNDPDRASTRIDPDAYRAAQDQRDPAEVVRAGALRIETALAAGVLDRQVVMSQARMDGPAVLGMLLGEYVVHGWDLAVATGKPWAPPAEASEASLAFNSGMIAPEYRGDEGFFGAEIPVPDDAPALDRLLGNAGRDPHWMPPS